MDAARQEAWPTRKFGQDQEAASEPALGLHSTEAGVSSRSDAIPYQSRGCSSLRCGQGRKEEQTKVNRFLEKEFSNISTKVLDHVLQQQDALASILELGSRTNHQLAALNEKLNVMEEGVSARFRDLRTTIDLHATTSQQLAELLEKLGFAKDAITTPIWQPLPLGAKSATSLPPRKSSEFELTGGIPPVPDWAEEMNAEMKSEYTVDGQDTPTRPALHSSSAMSDAILTIDTWMRSTSPGEASPSVQRPSPEERDIIFASEKLEEKGVRDIQCCEGWSLSGLLEMISLILVVLNTLFTGMQVNTNMECLYTGMPQPKWMQHLDLGFTIVFTLELVMRMLVMGSKIFFTGEDKGWNIMDAVFVSSSLLEKAVSFADLSFVRVIRMFRVLRAFRALRGMRFVRDLRLMLAALISSTASFMWGFGLIFFVMFIVAIGVMQSATLVSEMWEIPVSEALFVNYGTVLTSIITLFKAVSGGNDWADLVGPLLPLSQNYVYGFILYIAVVVFGIMNVLTAVFCENASQISHVDKDLVIKDEMQRYKDDVKSLKRFFHHVSAKRDGKFTIDELREFLRSPKRRAMLSIMGVDFTETLSLFKVMDADGKGEVDLNTFVDTLMRFRGATKGCDTARLLFESKCMMIRMGSFMCYTCNNFDALFDALRIERRPVPVGDFFARDFLKKKEAEARTLLHRDLVGQLGTTAASVGSEGETNFGESVQKIMASMRNTAYVSEASQPQVDDSHGGGPGFPAEHGTNAANIGSGGETNLGHTLFKSCSSASDKSQLSVDGSHGGGPGFPAERGTSAASVGSEGETRLGHTFKSRLFI